MALKRSRSAAWIIFFFPAFIFLICCPETIMAQKSKMAKKLRQAELFFDKGEVESAIMILQKIVQKDSTYFDAWLLMGGVQMELNHPTEAQKAFEKAYRLDSVSFPPLKLFLGRLAYQNADYPLAYKMLSSVLLDSVLKPSEKEWAEDFQKRAKSALCILKNPLDTELLSLGMLVATSGDEYINFVDVTGNKMVLTRKSLRENTSDGEPKFSEKFMVLKKEQGVWQKPKWLDVPWSNTLNSGGMSMSADGRSMLFTGCYWPDGSGSCDLYYCNKVGDEWQLPQRFNTAINTSGWESQPVISADGGTLYFSSKRPGGKGGADIWKTVYLSGKGWSPPVNLGDSVNTSGDEMAPFIHGDGQTLYFSSNGHPGMGGYDLFLAERDLAGRWSNATNLGVPVNSAQNEINVFVALDGKKGWVSSDRKGGAGGFDIWEFDVPPKIAPKPLILLSGRVVDSATGNPLEASVIVRDLKTQLEIEHKMSDPETGEFLAVLSPRTPYLFNISKVGFLFYSEQINYDTGFLSVSKTYALQPALAGASINLYQVNFDFNSDMLLPISAAELDRVVDFLIENPDLSIDIIGHTDAVGSEAFNQSLSQRRAQSVANYLLQKGIALPRLAVFGKGDNEPIGSNDTEEGRALNRRTEIRVR